MEVELQKFETPKNWSRWIQITEKEIMLTFIFKKIKISAYISTGTKLSSCIRKFLYEIKMGSRRVCVLNSEGRIYNMNQCEEIFIKEEDFYKTFTVIESPEMTAPQVFGSEVSSYSTQHQQ